MLLLLLLLVLFVISTTRAALFCGSGAGSSLQPTVVASPPRGVYSDVTSLQVVLRVILAEDADEAGSAVADDEGSWDYVDDMEIRYTRVNVGGFAGGFEEPSSTVGTAYVRGQKVVVDEALTLLAVAYCPETEVVGAISAHTYVLIEHVVENGASHGFDPRYLADSSYAASVRDGLVSLPVVSLTTPTGIVEPAERPAVLEFLYSNEPARGYSTRCAAKHYGNAGLAYPKKSIRLYFRKEYGNGKMKHDIFAGSWFPKADPTNPTREFDRLHLHSGSHDTFNYPAAREDYASWIHNCFYDMMMLRMSTANPHCRYASLFLNGRYHGQFLIRERFDTRHFLNYFGDGVYESVNKNLPFSGSGAAWASAQAAAVAHDYATVKQFVDMPALSNFMILMFLVVNADFNYKWNWAGAGSTLPNQIGYRFHGSDSDLSFRSVNKATDFTGQVGPGKVFGNLRAATNYEFLSLVQDLVFKHLKTETGALKPKALQHVWHYLSESVNKSMILETGRWGTPFNPRFTRETWRTLIDRQRNNYLTETRHNLLKNQLFNIGFLLEADPPEFSFSFSSTEAQDSLLEAFDVTNPSDQVVLGIDSLPRLHINVNRTGIADLNPIAFYTTDGTDPRFSPESINESPSSIRVVDQTSILLTESLTIRARMRVEQFEKWSGKWSPERRLDVVIDSGSCNGCGQILFTEVFYEAPSSGPLAGSEFVELQSISKKSINIGGWSIGDGINCRIPLGTVLLPGSFFVVARSPYIFEQTFKIKANATFLGRLKNKGETVTLRDALNRPVAQVTYGSRFPSFPELAAGGGASLVLKSRPANVGELRVEPPENWILSNYPSPFSFSVNHTELNSVREARIALETLIITEALLKPAAGECEFIEIHNVGQEAVDISLWVIADSLENARKGFRFQNGTILDFDSFLFVDTLSFSLSSAGETIYILPSDSDGRLFGVYSETVIGAGLREGVSLGRVSMPHSNLTLPSQPVIFAPLLSPSPGERNGAYALPDPPVYLSQLSVGPEPDLSFVQIRLLPQPQLDNSSCTTTTTACSHNASVILKPARSTVAWRLENRAGDVSFDFGQVSGMVQLTASNPVYLTSAESKERRELIREVHELEEDALILGNSASGIGPFVSSLAASGIGDLVLLRPALRGEDEVVMEPIDIAIWGEVSSQFGQGAENGTVASLQRVPHMPGFVEGAWKMVWRPRCPLNSLLCGGSCVWPQGFCCQGQCRCQLGFTGVNCQKVEVPANGAGSLSAGELAGVVIGCIIVLGLIIALAMCVLRQRRRRSGSAETSMGKTTASLGSRLGDSRKMLHRSDSRLRHSTGNRRRSGRYSRSMVNGSNGGSRKASRSNIYQAAPHRMDLSCTPAPPPPTTPTSTIALAPLPPPIAVDASPAASFHRVGGSTAAFPTAGTAMSALVHHKGAGFLCTVCGQAYVDDANLAIHKERRGH